MGELSPPPKKGIFGEKGKYLFTALNRDRRPSMFTKTEPSGTPFPAMKSREFTTALLFIVALNIWRLCIPYIFYERVLWELCMFYLHDVFIKPSVSLFLFNYPVCPRYFAFTR